MDKEERQKASGEQREDPRDFESISREEREGQSPAVGEEGSEVERGQWERTRDLHDEAKGVTNKADELHRRGGEENHDHSEG